MAEDILLFYHVKVGSSIVCAGFACASLLEGPKIFSEDLIPKFYFTERGESCPESSRAGGKHAIEHVNAQGGT